MVSGMAPKFSKVDEEKLNLLLAWNSIGSRLRSMIEVNSNFDVPYLAGYSVNGKVVYFDRHLPPFIKVKGIISGNKTIDPKDFIIWHEILEKSLIDYVGMGYDEAHKYATLYEHRFVSGQGLDVVDYEKQLQPFIKHDEHEKLTYPPYFSGPRALDLTPYTGRLKEHLKSFQVQ